MTTRKNKKRKTPEINPEFRVSSNKLLDLLKQYALVREKNLATEQAF